MDIREKCHHSFDYLSIFISWSIMVATNSSWRNNIWFYRDFFVCSAEDEMMEFRSLYKRNLILINGIDKLILMDTN